MRFWVPLVMIAFYALLSAALYLAAWGGCADVMVLVSVIAAPLGFAVFTRATMRRLSFAGRAWQTVSIRRQPGLRFWSYQLVETAHRAFERVLLRDLTRAQAEYLAHTLRESSLLVGRASEADVEMYRSHGRSLSHVQRPAPLW